MSSVVQEKSEEFALRIIKLYQYMTTREQNREYVLSKQLLRSGTSIGANIAEAEFGISKDDFKAKMYIALKECNESRYWLRLLNRASYLSNEEFRIFIRILVRISSRRRSFKNYFLKRGNRAHYG